MVDRTASGAFDGEAQNLTFGQQAVACAATDFPYNFHGKHPCGMPGPAVNTLSPVDVDQGQRIEPSIR
jgi:hypothetical protein